MTYDFTQKVTDFDGETVKDEYATGATLEDGRPDVKTRDLTYALLARAILLANPKDEEADKKFQSYEVMLKIGKNPQACELKDEDRSLIREKAGKVMHVFGAGAMKVFLDNPIPNMTNMEKVN